MKPVSNPVLTGSLYPILILVVSFLIQTCSGQAGLQTERSKGFPFRKQNVSLLEKPIESSPSSEITNDPTRPWRLPLNIVPMAYDMILYPVLESGFEESIGEQWTVPGISIITIIPQNDTNQIVFHMKNITFQALAVTTSSGYLFTIIGTNYNEEYNFYTIFLRETLEAGVDYYIQSMFTSYIQTELHGLYRSSYVDLLTGETKWIATSQMEALSARELFPCFDEPQFKAVFQVSIARQEKHVALTNTPIDFEGTSEIAPGWYMDTFEPTVKMSTYLFALIISEFEYAEAPGTILPETVVRTYSPAHFIRRDGGIYAAQKGAEALAFYGEYFGQDYPLPKMDLAAVPDFFFGAMENFGLNIYREALLLYFPDESTEAERYLLTTVIAHELGHQWFGNLVSPAFWTHIWLNEGMTSFVEYIGLQAIVPEFNPHDMFLSDTLHGALAADVDTTRPLKIDENAWYTQEAMSWFDGITYDKGGSLGRMMQGFLSESVMQLGLRRYQNRMKYAAAEQDDLFSDLTIEAAAANKLPTGYTMKDIMDTWTLQPGFPLINVTRAALGSIQISQTKFGNDSSPNRWIVPLSIATKEAPTFDPEPEYFLLSDNLIMAETPSSWVIVNAGATGYYRVKYDAYLLELIVDQLTTDHSVIETHTKSNLIDDHFAFAYRGISPIDDALALTLYLGTGQAETEIAVWIAVLDNLSRPNNLFSSTPIYGNMISYLLPRLTRAIDALGGPGAVGVDTKGVDVLRHTLLLDWACSYGDLKCLTYALTLVAAWQINPTINPVPRDLKPIFYCGAISTGGADILQFIQSQYNSTTSAKESTYLLNSLACVHDDLLINRLLNSTLQDGYFKEKSEASAFLQRLARNPVARPALVSFLSQNVQAIIQYFGNTSAITGTFNALSNYMSTAEELTSLERFILENQAVFQGSLDAIANRVRSNVAWVAQYGPAMQIFFAQNS